MGSLALAAGLAVSERVGVASEGQKPTIFVVGDSTAHNSGKGKNGEQMVGWGTPLADYFDATRVSVENVGHAGQSSRTYYTGANDWKRVVGLMKRGDFVLLVFGINDGGPPKTAKARGSIPGLGEETLVLRHDDGSDEVVHTYGWYMRRMAQEAISRGARVYLLTVTVRDIWTNPLVKYADATPIGQLPGNYDPKDDRIERGTGGGAYTRWTKALGAELGLPVVDLTNLCADRYEALGRVAVAKLYSDHNHTYQAGAALVAETIVSGLKAFRTSPFNAILSERGRAVVPADPRYVQEGADR